MSAGANDLSPGILGEVSRQKAFPITRIFDKSLQEGKGPNNWKFANVAPICPKGERWCTSNYRPIILTSVLGIVLGTIITEKISFFVYKLILCDQHGFRYKRSCLTKVTEFSRYIYNIRIPKYSPRMYTYTSKIILVRYCIKDWEVELKLTAEEIESVPGYRIG